MVADFLHRKSTGLTHAHRALIKILAAIAVEQYLAEVGSGSECPENDAPIENVIAASFNRVTT